MWDDTTREFDRNLVETMEAPVIIPVSSCWCPDIEIHSNTLAKIEVVDFTLDDVLDEVADVGITPELAKSLTCTPPSLESAKHEDARKVMVRMRDGCMQLWLEGVGDVDGPIFHVRSACISDYLDRCNTFDGQQQQLLANYFCSSNIELAYAFKFHWCMQKL
ncbi:hypothetical protein Tco_0889111 [Tanacetum coccineum]